MQKLLIPVLILGGFLFMAACTKSANRSGNHGAGTIPKKSFFKNETQAFNLVQKAIWKFHADEKLVAIEHISYMYSGDTAYAIVFYRSSKGSKNIMIRKTSGEDDDFVGDVTKCDGESCDCKVHVVFGDDGGISVSCSCPSLCKLITSQGLE